MSTPGNFEAAFDRLFPMAEDAARHVVGDETAAEDVAVETLARARHRWDRVGAGNVEAWVLRTAMSLAEKKGPQTVVGASAPRRSPHLLLELVTRRAERLRLRRRTIVIASVALLLAAAIGIPIAATAPSSHHVVAGPPTTAALVTTPTFDQTTLVPDTTSIAAPTTVAPPTTVVATTTSLACRNSSDPHCGAFRWDPAPGPNQAIVINVTFTPQSPHPGDPVTFTAHVVDPDASPIMAGEETCNPPGFGDVGTSRCTPTCSAPGYGPWTPPTRQRGERTVTYSHTYTDAGTYTARFWFASSGGCARNPYASAADQQVTVNVS